MSAESNIRKLYVIKMAKWFMLTMPILMLYYKDHASGRQLNRDVGMERGPGGEGSVAVEGAVGDAVSTVAVETLGAAAAGADERLVLDDVGDS